MTRETTNTPHRAHTLEQDQPDSPPVTLIRRFAVSLRDLFTSHRLDFFRVSAGFLALLSFRWSDKIVEQFAWLGVSGDVVVAAYWIGLAITIFWELHKIRRPARDITCDALFQKDTLAHTLCRKRVVLWVIGVPFALIASASALVFIYLADTATIAVLAVDVIVFALLSSLMRRSVTMVKPTEAFERVLVPIVQILANMAVVVLSLVAIEIYTYYISVPATIVNPLADPNAVASDVVNAVNHSSWYFRTLARFVYLNQLMMRGLLTVPVEGKYLYAVFYLTHLATIPAAAISILYKFCLRSVP